MCMCIHTQSSLLLKYNFMLRLIKPIFSVNNDDVQYLPSNLECPLEFPLQQVCEDCEKIQLSGKCDDEI
jgi:hypothetical protein